MLTLDAVKSAILECLTEHEMTEAEIYRWICAEMNPWISHRDVYHAIKVLIADGKVRSDAQGNSVTLFWKVR